MRLTKIALAAGLALATALPLLHQAAAADYKDEYKISTVVPAPFPWGIAADKWAELVGQRTNGRIKMKVYPGSQLVSGDQTKEFTAMRRGIIDMAVGSTINWSPQVKELNLFSLPFLMPDYKAIDALTHGPVGDKLFQILRDKGVVPLAWGENGFREVSNSRHPIRKPADLEGLKMRVVGSPLFNDTFTALGANPTQMSWADAKPALTTGAVDGQENPVSVFTIAKIYAVGQTNLTLWHYVADPLIFAVNKEVFESFTPEDQKIVREAAVEAGALCVELARKGLTDGDTSAIEEVRKLGVDVVELTPAEHQAFVDATRGVYKDWTQKIGPDLVKMAEDSIAKR
ncbi:tripartite ATP-independent transporter solute receptor, DctP family [Tistlia consotensis]|uniref:Tripartite ATP-independent transporter solute receptor, DctP family n=1 Tax=Tistlia consotensis USBA 355 TaxID=560819 RepID=A0A1Y6B3Q5_9PROT|nr:DctP family TRAP transporter solute-binding subunit [Tistlia consotensis]SME89921.1 tripartite ATP-independent transporter solute receptor, DctP family [Tistlia consotensis USBA 355]SNR26444.1 tripartite ATP-independent transporter solute receptor, DctP family [Tistlia consotensis]